MGNNFGKMTILYKGEYHQIDKKPKFHQAACKHKFIKAQIVKTADDLIREIEADKTEKGTFKATQKSLRLSKALSMDKLPIGRLPKAVNLCKKCGKVKIRNN